MWFGVHGSEFRVGASSESRQSINLVRKQNAPLLRGASAGLVILALLTKNEEPGNQEPSSLIPLRPVARAFDELVRRLGVGDLHLLRVPDQVCCARMARLPRSTNSVSGAE